MSFITRDSGDDLEVKVKTNQIAALIDAGDSNGTSDRLTLVKAELWLKPLVEGFLPVKAPPASLTITGAAGSLEIPYVLDVSSIPVETNTYAYIYTSFSYSAFCLGAGSVWSVRSGIDLNAFDTGATGSGARVLVKIGDPKETTEEAQIVITE
ncbi:MAG: hypothetical protein LBG14_05930 [Treponema sp.]|jgi:hypothetical protein|nr:hypothetical protein [Treponema sp.]